MSTCDYIISVDGTFEMVCMYKSTNRLTILIYIIHYYMQYSESNNWYMANMQVIIQWLVTYCNPVINLCLL